MLIHIIGNHRSWKIGIYLLINFQKEEKGYRFIMYVCFLSTNTYIFCICSGITPRYCCYRSALILIESCKTEYSLTLYIMVYNLCIYYTKK